MKLPRDLKGEMLAKKLGKLGYTVVRQRGSHMTVRTETGGGHTIWIPAGKFLAVGTLSALPRQKTRFGPIWGILLLMARHGGAML